MKAKLKIGVASVVVAAATAVGVGVAAQADASGWKARATLRGADGTEIGQVTFQGKRDETDVRVKLDHLPPNWSADAFHGFHIHANNTGTDNGCLADLTQASNQWFVSADGHWKDDGQDHAGHNGDMPSVLVNADGSAANQYAANDAAATTATKNTGNAGDRLACGVIERKR